MEPIVVFSLGMQRCGLPLSRVERVVRMVAVRPLPKAPPIVCGVVNLQGRILPVVDAARRFGLPPRPLRLEDQLLVARTPRRSLAMVVDGASGVLPRDAADQVSAEALVPGAEYLQGVLRLPDGLILVHDLDAFLSLEEAQALDEALRDG